MAATVGAEAEAAKACDLNPRVEPLTKPYPTNLASALTVKFESIGMSAARAPPIALVEFHPPLEAVDPVPVNHPWIVNGDA
jgi:hypothetical protein